MIGCAQETKEQMMANPVKSAGLITGIVENARLGWRLFRDQRVPVLTKLLIPGVALAYLLLPVDLLPDVLPGLGQLDDIAMIAFALKLFVDKSPTWLVQWHRDEMAGRTPKGETVGRESTVDGEYRVID
jgi:uncharacterized membrane protein YkvA (DUF1232 family)